MPPGNVLIDGSRSLAEIDHFRSVLGSDLKVIGISAAEDIRFRRLVARGREDDPSELEGFRTRDRRELSWGLGEALEHADITVSNNGTIEEFKSQCQSLIKSIMEEHGKPL